MERARRSGTRQAHPILAQGFALAAAALVATSCSGGGGGSGGVTITDSPGAGTATLAVRGQVDVRDTVVATSTLYTTSFSVEVWSDVNRTFPVSGAAVTITDPSGAVTSLKEDLPVGPGRYVARVLGYPGSFALNVNAQAQGTLAASIVGPPIHSVSLSQSPPIAVNAPTTVTWSPSGVTTCERAPNCVEIAYSGLVVGPVPLPIPDNGSYALPVKGVALDNWLATEPGRTDEERIEITRFKRIALDADKVPPGGALAGSGSFLDLSVRVRTLRLNTTDTRVNSIAGSVDDPTTGPCANPAGNVVVAVWPDSNPFPIDVATALASATVLDASFGGVAAPAPFTFGNLEPWAGGARYLVRAWVDTDGDGRLDPGECFAESPGAMLAPSPAAALDVGLLTLNAVF